MLCWLTPSKLDNLLINDLSVELVRLTHEFQIDLERREWQVVDAPLVHNVKVVNGFREKGVCQDWADAMEIALHAEGFRTLDIHRAIANARNIKLEHATVIVTAHGQPWDSGLILDPWRIGQGRLYTARVGEDDRYNWESREAVRAWTREWKARALAQQG